MKNISLFAIIATVFIFSACTKNNSSNTAVNTTGLLEFHMHTLVDTNEVDTYGLPYIMTGGRKISVNIAQLYISNVQLLGANNTVLYTVPNSYALKVMQTEPVPIGQVPAGNYTSVRFTIGLDSIANTKSPASNDSTFNQPKMWFGNTAQPGGYVFVNFQGAIDTTRKANGNTLVPFAFKVGTNANKRTVTMPAQAFSVIGTQTQLVHLLIDYNKLFTGIDLTNLANLTLTTSAANSSALGKQLANNIPLMFTYEK